jgi:RNA-directed DNA polymerase
MDRLKDKVRTLTARTSGVSMECSITRLNEVLRGWYGYFKHSHRTVFPHVDGYIRGRLRAILRKRAGRRGRARGRDHHRWPNRYFTELGLFSLTQAHASSDQSPR